MQSEVDSFFQSFLKKTSLFFRQLVARRRTIEIALKKAVKKPAKIGVLSDIEGSIEYAQKAAGKLKQEDIDCIIIAGDSYENHEIKYHPRFPYEKDKRRQMKQGLLPFVKLGVPVYIIPGNHENKNVYRNVLKELRKKHKNLFDITGKTVKRPSFAIVGLGGFHDFMLSDPDALLIEKRDHKKAEKEIKKLSGKQPIIFVSHGPPLSTAFIDMVDGFGHTGDVEITRILDENVQDVINIHGHIHERGGEYEKFRSGISINIAAITDFRNKRFSNTAVIELVDDKAFYREI
ncbi:MAG: metallophosphoesterase family protein [Nanoarchaeota archaeon]